MVRHLVTGSSATFCVLLVCLITCVSAQANPPSEEIQSKFQAGVRAMKSSNFKEAEACFRACTELDPGCESYWVYLGTAQQGYDDCEAALKSYGKARLLASTKEHQDAVDRYLLVANAQLLISQGMRMQVLGEYKLACKLFSQALDYSPKNARLHSTLGFCLCKTGDLGSARAEYQPGYNLDPTGESQNSYCLAVLDDRMNYKSLALQEYETYIRDNPAGAYTESARKRVRELLEKPLRENMDVDSI